MQNTNRSRRGFLKTAAAAAGGFPALSMTGQFLIKDVALLGLAAWTLADALHAGREGERA